MKYPGMEWGTMEAVVNKLGGMDGVHRFLSGELVAKVSELLKFVREISVPGTKKFVAADAFSPNNSAGIKFWLGDNFKKHFLGKTEEDVEPANIAVHQLEKSSRDPEIMAELGEKRRVIKLAHFYGLIKAQANGQEGPLLVNGYVTIAHIEDGESGNIWAVRAIWCSFCCEWYVRASSVEGPDEWDAGNQVLSRK